MGRAGRRKADAAHLAIVSHRADEFAPFWFSKRAISDGLGSLVKDELFSLMELGLVIEPSPTAHDTS
jgi:hypothetical protein